MSENVYDSKVCEITHESIDKILDEHGKLLDEHSKDICDLKEDGREYKTEIKNLIKKMDDFISVIKFGLSIFVTISIFVIGTFLVK